METLYSRSAEELQKYPHDSRQISQNSLYTDQDTPEEAGRPDESGTDPKRYEPGKFKKGPMKFRRGREYGKCSGAA